MNELDRIILEHQVDRVVDENMSISSYTYKGQDWGCHDNNIDDSWHKEFILTELATTVEDAIHTAITEGVTLAEVGEVLSKVVKQV